MALSTACARGSHSVCRGRVLNLEATRPADRFSACECECGHLNKRRIWKGPEH